MIVQTCSGLRRSQRRSARNLALAMLRLLPKVVTPTPPALHTQADASDAPHASTAIAIASVARPVLSIPFSLSLPFPEASTKHGIRAELKYNSTEPRGYSRCSQAL